MAAAVKLEPMFLNPIDAAFHASIELGRIQSGAVANEHRLKSILDAMTDDRLRASGAMYGMTSLTQREVYSHIIEINRSLDSIERLYADCGRDIRSIDRDIAADLKSHCERIHEHYQAARWIEDRAGSAR